VSINIVIPMAGAGIRFIKAGFKNPKPFINVLNKFMIFHVIDNINIPGAKYIFLCQKDHLKNFGSDFVDQIRKRTFIKDFEIIGIEGLTDGAACTVLKAKEFIDNRDELLIVNSDQLVGSSDIINSVLMFEKNKLDGGILCFFNKSIKWSYVNINDDRLITRVAEKQVISEHATVGIYYFKHGADFVSCAENMVSKNDRINGEFYVAPVYNYMILENKKLGPYFINEMQGLGTPEDLEVFLRK
jgi:dTDP-glucose pyrophosphorylase